MIEVEKKDDYICVKIGQLLNKSYANDLAFSLHENMDRGFKFVLINFTAVDTIDSAGLEVISKLNKELVSLRGSMILFNVNTFVKKVMALTRIDKKLVICDNKEQAENEVQNLL